MLNAVADSTVLVSAFLRQEGLSAILLRHAARRAFALSLSEEIIAETATVLLGREYIPPDLPW
jgi:predicted nucleic acid-binding protein